MPWLKRHAFERGGREVVPLPWHGLAEAIEAGRHPDAASVPTVPDDCVVALLDPYASTQAARFAEPVDCAAVTADRVHAQLVRTQALARRKRPGRILLRSSHPVRAQAALPGRRPSGAGHGAGGGRRAGVAALVTRRLRAAVRRWPSSQRVGSSPVAA